MRSCSSSWCRSPSRVSASSSSSTPAHGRRSTQARTIRSVSVTITAYSTTSSRGAPASPACVARPCPCPACISAVCVMLVGAAVRAPATADATVSPLLLGDTSASESARLCPGSPSSSAATSSCSDRRALRSVRLWPSRSAPSAAAAVLRPPSCASITAPATTVTNGTVEAQRGPLGWPSRSHSCARKMSMRSPACAAVCPACVTRQCPRSNARACATDKTPLPSTWGSVWHALGASTDEAACWRAGCLPLCRCWRYCACCSSCTRWWTCLTYSSLFSNSVADPTSTRYRPAPACPRPALPQPRAASAHATGAHAGTRMQERGNNTPQHTSASARQAR